MRQLVLSSWMYSFTDSVFASLTQSLIFIFLFYTTKDLVSQFNFHHYDNLKFTAQKIDPCKRKVDSRATEVVKLLFCAFNGDVSSLRRFLLYTNIDQTLVNSNEPHQRPPLCPWLVLVGSRNGFEHDFTNKLKLYWGPYGR